MTRSGEIAGQASESGAAITVLAAGGHSYVKLSAAFLRIAHLPAAACAGSANSIWISPRCNPTSCSPA